MFLKLLQWKDEDVEVRLRNGKPIYGITRIDDVGEFFDEEGLTPLLGPDGKQVKGKPVYNDDGSFVIEEDGSVKTKAQLMKGRVGNHGWDFRNLFYVPEGWCILGSDMSGIELRALAHVMAPYDNGEYVKLVMSGDPHTYNQQAMELASRDVAKTTVYALVYGAQDYKLGCTVDPSLANYPEKAKALGKLTRQRLMSRIPALAAATKAIQREARSGSVEAMDGRQLFSRAKHSALNTKLQGIGATLAKKWCLLFESYMEALGYVHGWDGDFVIMAWVHDELQVAIRGEKPRFERGKEAPEGELTLAENARACIIQAAFDAGIHFDFATPIDVEVKFGFRWSQTH